MSALLAERRLLLEVRFEKEIRDLRAALVDRPYLPERALRRALTLLVGELRYRLWCERRFHTLSELVAERPELRRKVCRIEQLMAGNRRSIDALLDELDATGPFEDLANRLDFRRRVLDALATLERSEHAEVSLVQQALNEDIGSAG
jgi:hypothetical protein